MIDLFKTLFFQIGSGFLTTNTTRAEHRNFFMFLRIQMLFYIFRKLAEAFSVRVYRIFKGTDLHFIVITCIDQQDVRIADQLIPFFGFDIGAYRLFRINAFHTHGDDFTF